MARPLSYTDKQHRRATPVETRGKPRGENTVVSSLIPLRAPPSCQTPSPHVPWAATAYLSHDTHASPQPHRHNDLEYSPGREGLKQHHTDRPPPGGPFTVPPPDLEQSNRQTMASWTDAGAPPPAWATNLMLTNNGQLTGASHAARHGVPVTPSDYDGQPALSLRHPYGGTTRPAEVKNSTLGHALPMTGVPGQVHSDHENTEDVRLGELLPLPDSRTAQAYRHECDQPPRLPR